MTAAVSRGPAVWCAAPAIGWMWQASGRSITDAVAGRELVPQDSLGEKVVPVPKPQPKAEAAAKTEGTAQKA